MHHFLIPILQMRFFRIYVITQAFNHEQDATQGQF